MPIQGFTPLKLYFGQKGTADKSDKSLRPQRAPRRALTGAGLLAQKCQLLFGPEHSPSAAFACRVTDVSNGGYCISLLGQSGLPPNFRVGLEAFLEQSDRTLMPVELRWIQGTKIGLKRLPRSRPR